jgi:D-alanine-D-alanine ligase
METLYTNHWKNKIQQLSHTYFKGKWVYVDDAETEFPIDKNDFSTTVNGNKSISTAF